MNLSTIMSNAHYFWSIGLFMTWSECLKASWRRAKISKQLKAGVVKFDYIKKDKTLRRAIGSVNTSLFDQLPKGTGIPTKPEIVKYFDFEKQSWRSFRLINFVPNSAKVVRIAKAPYLKVTETV